MDYKKVNEDFYSKGYWGIDRSKNKWFSKYVKARVIGKMIDGKKGVLYDAGGGVGNWAWYFKNGFEKIIVSDISKKSLEKIPEKEIIKIECSVLKNKLKDKSVDVVLLIDVFEHIQKNDLTEMMSDLRRILKDDGIIVIYTGYYGYGYGIIWQRVFHPERRLLFGEENEGHVNRLNFREYLDLFEKSGLKIKSYYFYSVIFQQMTDKIKDVFARVGSKISGRGKVDAELGRAGQSIKEEFREKEEKPLFKLIFKILSKISYLDIYLGKIISGNSIFICLEKKV